MRKAKGDAHLVVLVEQVPGRGPVDARSPMGQFIGPAGVSDVGSGGTG